MTSPRHRIGHSASKRKAVCLISQRRVLGHRRSPPPAGQKQLALNVQLAILQGMLPVFEASQNIPANVALVQQIIAAIKVVNGQL